MGATTSGAAVSAGVGVAVGKAPSAGSATVVSAVASTGVAPVSASVAVEGGVSVGGTGVGVTVGGRIGVLGTIVASPLLSGVLVSVPSTVTRGGISPSV